MINTEKWYGEITGYDINDKNKYAGTSGIIITHFFLCGNREYLVHHLGDPWNIWSNKYRDCNLPAGNGVPIDGICIINGKYRARLTNGKWLKEISRCNIEENNGETFAGQIGETISSVAIDGGDIYSVAVGSDTGDKEANAIKVFKNLFGYELSFTKEDEIIHFRVGNDIVFVELVKSFETIQDGDITFMVENGEVKGYKWNKKIEKNEIQVVVNKITNTKPIEFKMKITEAFKKGMSSGEVSISYDIINKAIVMEAMTKFNTKRATAMGGFRITIKLGDNSKKQFMYAFSKYPELWPEEKRKELIRRPKIPNVFFNIDNFFHRGLSEEGLIAIKIAATVAIIFATGNVLSALPLTRWILDN